jgi:hypothetical protein
MSEDLIELIAPGGCDEANHGSERYRVDNSGRVRVPRDAAFYLIKFGGFRPLPIAPPETTAPNDEAGANQSAPDPRRVPRRSK